MALSQILAFSVLLQVALPLGTDWCRQQSEQGDLNRTLPTPLTFTRDIFDTFGDNKTCTIKNEGYQQLLKRLKIGSPHKQKSRETVTDHNVPNEYVNSVVSQTCYSGKQLLEIHSVDISTGITHDAFVNMSASFVQQIASRNCETVKKVIKRGDKLTQPEMFGWGSLVVFIICLGTLPGGLLAPLMDKAVYRYVLAGMMGLAVGSLLGDGVLHVIPDALGLGDLQPTPPEMEGKIYVAPYTWKLLCLCCAAWLFFILELIFSYIGLRGQQQVDLSSVHVNEGYVSSSGNLTNGSQNGDVQSVDVKDPNIDLSTEKKSPMSLAYMILIGDGIHNFADGLAIGAAFNVGWRSGLSTSIAIFCHEVPHELGDFAALLSVGWSYKKAMLMNFISGLSAFLGLYVGIPVANNQVARQWIFAITAGMFLYIALSDLVPELLEYFRTYNPKYIAVAENLGILVGLVIMMIIVIFEDHIVV